MGRHDNLEGSLFTRLTVTGLVGRNKQQNIIWECLCSCGNKTKATTADLRSGNTRSCGCLQKEKATIHLLSISVTHGLSKDINGKKTRLFRIWTGIKTRCFNEHDKAFKNYGGRGISLCSEWLNFESFHNWAVENGYLDTLSIERKDTNGDYMPDNCTWVTAKVQANNRRGNRLIEYRGKTQTMAQWSNQYEISIATLFSRLERGWSIEKALIAPIGKNYRKKVGA